MAKTTLKWMFKRKKEVRAVENIMVENCGSHDSMHNVWAPLHRLGTDYKKWRELGCRPNVEAVCFFIGVQKAV